MLPSRRCSCAWSAVPRRRMRVRALTTVMRFVTLVTTRFSERRSGPIASRDCSASVAWAGSTRACIRRSAVASRSRCCRASAAIGQISSSGSSRRPRRSTSSRTRTSSTCSIWRRCRMVARTSSWSFSMARRSRRSSSRRAQWGRCRSVRSRGSRPRCSTRSRPHTRRASSIAISSPITSSCRPRGARRCSTSGSRSSSRSSVVARRTPARCSGRRTTWRRSKRPERSSMRGRICTRSA